MGKVATIGFFDGVHLGHQAVLNNLVQLAHEADKQSVVFTFIEHPKKFFSPDIPFPLLTTPSERQSLLSEYADQVVMLKFDEVHSLTAAEFLQLINEDYQVDELLLGYNNFFGSDKITDAATYERVAQNFDIAIRRGSELKFNNANVSSTRIRQAIGSGDIPLANELLGYKYKLSGVVVKGRQIGHQLGFPTANLMPDNNEKMIPADGVYAVKAELQNAAVHVAIANIGCNPTFDSKDKTIEVHIPNTNKSLYGQKLKISFLEKLRDEVKFPNTISLQKQIANDIQRLEKYT